MSDKAKQLIQTVVITLSDGSSQSFTGPAMVFPGDEGKANVVKVAFTPPRELPDGYRIEEIGKEAADV